MVRRAELPEKPSRGARRARERARDETRSRAPGRTKSRNPLNARRGLTHRHAKTSRVRGASRGRVLWTGVAFRDAIERARPGYRRRGPRPGPRARAADRRAARCESRLVTHRRHGSPVVAASPTRPPGPRDDTAASRAVPGARPINNETASAGTFASPAAAAIRTLLLLRTFMTACMFSGTRFSAAARFRRGKHDAAASTGHFTPRDSHRVRRASPHPGARASCAFSIHALGPLACDLSFA
jgi:hypothetical protein